MRGSYISTNKKAMEHFPFHRLFIINSQFIFKYFRTGRETAPATTQQMAHSKIACTPTSSTMNINALAAPSVFARFCTYSQF